MAGAWGRVTVVVRATSVLSPLPPVPTAHVASRAALVTMDALSTIQ